MSILNERIKQRREQLEMSQAKLAELLGYSDRSTIAKIEKGTNDITQSKIEAFAKALRTTPAYLMGWEDNSGEQDVGLTALDVAKWLNVDAVLVESVMNEMGWFDAANPETLSKISAEVERRKVKTSGDNSVKAQAIPPNVNPELLQSISNLSEADQQLILAVLKRMRETGEDVAIAPTKSGPRFIFNFENDPQELQKDE